MSHDAYQFSHFNYNCHDREMQELWRMSRDKFIQENIIKKSRKLCFHNLHINNA